MTLKLQSSSQKQKFSYVHCTYRSFLCCKFFILDFMVPFYYILDSYPILINLGICLFSLVSKSLRSSSRVYSMCVCSLLKGHRSGKSLRVRKRREESSEASKSFAPKSERSCISASPICWRVILSNIHSKPKRKATKGQYISQKKSPTPARRAASRARLWIIIEFSRDTAPFFTGDATEQH